MEIIEAIKTRRSINFFQPDREVSEEKIRELLSLANLAPSSFNLQPWRVVAVRDKELKRTLRACAMNQPKAEEASFMLIIVADPQGVELNRDRMLQSWLELGFMKSEEQKEPMRGMIAGLYGEKDSLTRKVFAVKNELAHCRWRLWNPLARYR